MYLQEAIEASANRKKWLKLNSKINLESNLGKKNSLITLYTMSILNILLYMGLQVNYWPTKSYFKVNTNSF